LSLAFRVDSPRSSCAVFFSASEIRRLPVLRWNRRQHFPARHRGLRQAYIKHVGVCAGPAFGCSFGGALMQRLRLAPVFSSRSVPRVFSGFTFWLARSAAFSTRFSTCNRKRNGARARIAEHSRASLRLGTFLGHFGGNYFYIFC